MSANGKQKAVIEEVVEQVEATADASDSEGSEAELQHPNVPSASTPSTSSKSKKKKRSKVAKALNSLRGGGKDSVPQEVVDVVLDKVRNEHGDSIPGGPSAVNEELVRLALQQMKLKEVLQGKSGIGGKNTKDVGAHKVSRH